MRFLVVLSGSLLGLALCAAACGGSRPGLDFNNPDGGSSSGSGGGSGGSSGSSSGGSGGSSGSSGGFGDGGGMNGTPLIYAHTDSELYSMDPTTHVLTDIGAFTLTGGTTPTITDLAVDGNDDVWVNSETAIYSVALPSGGTGPVVLTLQTQLPSSTKFYALGFTPAGTLETGESLIAGDSDGNLWYVDVSQASSTPQELGGFGAASGGGTWELSGDVVFYTASGATQGLATLRQCTSSCSSKDDSLAQIDITAMQTAFTSKTPAPTLLKQLIGGGTGFGDLFGIGAWGNSVYAFSRASSSTSGAPAQLVQVGSTGTGVSLQSFTSITDGWSGAGVTTKAPVSVLQ
jgi:hypothetical protein